MARDTVFLLVLLVTLLWDWPKVLGDEPAEQEHDVGGLEGSEEAVLLDPDDPNPEKAASNITNPGVRRRSIWLAKFRQWLKYDADCMFLTTTELNVKIDQGRCAPIEATSKRPTTTKDPSFLSKIFKRKRRKKMNKSKKEGFFSHRRKENVVRSIVGDSNIRYVDVDESDAELDVIAGSIITLTCDEAARIADGSYTEDTDIVWYVNGMRMQTRWLNWRVSMSADGRLGLWPIGLDDAGHFECYVDEQLRAAVNINVITMTGALLHGTFNYLIVCFLFGTCIVTIGYFMGELAKAPVKTTEVDRLAEFLTEHVFKDRDAAKQHVAQAIEGQNVLHPQADQRALLEQPRKDNRSTIMLLLQQNKQPQKRGTRKLDLTGRETKSSQEPGRVQKHFTSRERKSSAKRASNKGSEESNRPDTEKGRHAQDVQSAEVEKRPVKPSKSGRKAKGDVKIKSGSSSGETSAEKATRNRFWSKNSGANKAKKSSSSSAETSREKLTAEKQRKKGPGKIKVMDPKAKDTKNVKEKIKKSSSGK